MYYAPEVEICALTRDGFCTLGRGRTYAAAIQNARVRAAVPHSLAALVLAGASPLIRAYSRPLHRWGVIVPCEAVAP